MRLLWKPSETVSLMVNADAANQRGVGEGWVITPHLAGTDRWEGSNSAANTARLIAATPPPLVPGIRVAGTSRQDNRFYNLSAQLDVDLRFATLTVIPAYRRANEDYDTWGGFLYYQKNVGDQYSVETRLGSDGQTLKWVIGAYYYDDSQNVDAGARDCQDFRVWTGIMGKKESHYVTTQRACDTERASGPSVSWWSRQRRL